MNKNLEMLKLLIDENQKKELNFNKAMLLYHAQHGMETAKKKLCKQKLVTANLSAYNSSSMSKQSQKKNKKLELDIKINKEL